MAERAEPSVHDDLPPHVVAVLDDVFFRRAHWHSAYEVGVQRLAQAIKLGALSVGAQLPPERELVERLHLVGLATEAEFECPLTQPVLADALGLTAIHVNRTLRQLRERKLLTMRAGKVEIHDLRGLRQLAGFSGGYLT